MLNGAVALVTGARGGIGRAICGALANAGARVVASGIGDAPEDLAADVWLQHDVTSADAWACTMGEIRKHFGRLDCLINNAGVALIERISDTTVEQFQRVMSVNVESVLLGLQASQMMLRESGRLRAGGSSVVNVSSVAGLRGVAFGATYCASKGAVTLLSKAAAKEFAALGYPIRVNTVHPAGVETRMVDSIMARHVEMGFSSSVKAAKADFITTHPFGRLAQPAEIAGCVVFLCSSAASYMTGSALIVDGGVTS